MRWTFLVRVMLLVTSLRSGLLFAQSTKPNDVSINGPTALAVYKDTYLFVVEGGGSSDRVLRIDLKNSEVTPVAGNAKDCCYEEGALATEVGFGYINSIAVDGKGNLLIADWHHVRKVDAQTGRIATPLSS